MKIRPKKGTKLESLLIEMNARLKQEEAEALDWSGHIAEHVRTQSDTSGHSAIRLFGIIGLSVLRMKPSSRQN